MAGRLAPYPRRMPALTSKMKGGGALDVEGVVPAVRCRVEGRKGGARSYWVPKWWFTAMRGCPLDGVLASYGSVLPGQWVEGLERSLAKEGWG